MKVLLQLGIITASTDLSCFRTEALMRTAFWIAHTQNWPKVDGSPASSYFLMYL